MGQTEFFEKRNGQGITLFISPSSNYGLTHYKPKELQEENDFALEQYNKTGKIRLSNGIDLDGKTAKAYIHCYYNCAAEKINNYKRYCAMCPDFFDFDKYVVEIAYGTN